MQSFPFVPLSLITFQSLSSLDSIFIVLTSSASHIFFQSCLFLIFVFFLFVCSLSRSFFHFLPRKKVRLLNLHEFQSFLFSQRACFCSSVMNASLSSFSIAQPMFFSSSKMHFRRSGKNLPINNSNHQILKALSY